MAPIESFTRFQLAAIIDSSIHRFIGSGGWAGWAGLDWLAGWLAGLAGWLARLAGLAGWAGWLAGWLGWLAGWLALVSWVLHHPKNQPVVLIESFTRFQLAAIIDSSIHRFIDLSDLAAGLAGWLAGWLACQLSDWLLAAGCWLLGG